MKLKRLAAFLIGLVMTVEAVPALVFAKEYDLSANDTEVEQTAEPEENGEPKEKETEAPKPKEKKETEKKETEKQETTVPDSNDKEPAASQENKAVEPEDKETEKSGEKETESSDNKEETQPETDAAGTDGKDNTDPEDKNTGDSGDKEPAEDSGKETEGSEDIKESETDAKETPESGDKAPEGSDENEETQPEDKENAEPEDSEPAGNGEKGVLKSPDSTVIVDRITGGSDNDELLEKYFKSKVESKVKKRALYSKSSVAANKLTGNSRKAYDVLKVQITEIAMGRRSSTVINVSLSALGLQDKYFTAADLGIKGGKVSVNGMLTAAASKALLAKLDINLRAIDNALLADYPLEMYWFDKTSGVSVAYPSYYGNEYEVCFASDCVFSFIVSKDYAPDNATNKYVTDSNKIKRVNTAISNAAAIVESEKGRPDYQILKDYKNKICALVSYDNAAARGGKKYGDSWQLISVFDGNGSTNVVCEGYSKAFMYLCELTTFQYTVSCITVTGTMSAPGVKGPHMWNVVKMDNGRNYLVDVTNCDDGLTGNEKLFMIGYSKVITNGYQCAGINYTYDSETKNTYQASDYALWSKKFSDTRYKLNLGPYSTAYGKAGLPKTSAYADDNIIVTAEPNNGYYYTVSVNGKMIYLNSFIMPSSDVNVDVFFGEIAQEEIGAIISDGRNNYKVTNNATDGTGTVAFAGVANGATSVTIPGITTLNGIPYKVTRILSTGFKYNKTVTSVYIGAYVTTIDSYAFQGCSKLTKISGGSRLRTIGTKAFAGCTKLKSFSISSAVLSKIGNSAFSGDKALKTINIKKTTKLTKKGVKKSLKGSKVKTVKVKKSKVKKYKKIFKKKNSGRKVKVKK